jgi:hypothetical protein
MEVPATNAPNVIPAETIRMVSMSPPPDGLNIDYV